MASLDENERLFPLRNLDGVLILACLQPADRIQIGSEALPIMSTYRLNIVTYCRPSNLTKEYLVVKLSKGQKASQCMPCL